MVILGDPAPVLDKGLGLSVGRQAASLVSSNVRVVGVVKSAIDLCVVPVVGWPAAVAAIVAEGVRAVDSFLLREPLGGHIGASCLSVLDGFDSLEH